MYSRILKRFLTPMLALTVTLGACDQVRNPVEATPPEQSSQLLSGLLSGSGSGTTSDNNGRTIVRGDNGADGGSVSAVIGLNGGLLSIGKHRLYVPKGAVAVPTRFTMTISDPELLMVRLQATVWDPILGTQISVGQLGFLQPLTLRLAFDQTEELVDAGRVMMVYVGSGGELQAIPSVVHPNEKWVDGTLDHFSHYAVGQH